MSGSSKTSRFINKVIKIRRLKHPLIYIVEFSKQGKISCISSTIARARFCPPARLKSNAHFCPCPYFLNGQCPLLPVPVFFKRAMPESARARIFCPLPITTWHRDPLVIPVAEITH